MNAISPGWQVCSETGMTRTQVVSNQAESSVARVFQGKECGRPDVATPESTRLGYGRFGAMSNECEVCDIAGFKP